MHGPGLPTRVEDEELVSLYLVLIRAEPKTKCPSVRPYLNTGPFELVLIITGLEGGTVGKLFPHGKREEIATEICMWRLGVH